jgi:ABC-type uncharacterized transport system auxiliary subunit
VNRRLVAVTTLTVVLSGCSATTFDSSLQSTTSTIVPATTLPVGTVEQLLPLMVAEVKALSEKVAANQGDDQSATYIEQLWAAMRPEITSINTDLVPSFEFVVRRCRQAADRSRPADADRAYRNIQALADSLLG